MNTDHTPGHTPEPENDPWETEMSDEFLTSIKQVVADPAAGPILGDLLNAEASHLNTALVGDEFDPGAGA